MAVRECKNKIFPLHPLPSLNLSLPLSISHSINLSLSLSHPPLTSPLIYCRHTLRCIITLLLLLSGNVQPNPGLATTKLCLQTPTDFLNRTGIGFIHMNVKSLLPKMDTVKIWANSTNADIVVVSETCLRRCIPGSHVHLDG